MTLQLIARLAIGWFPMSRLDHRWRWLTCFALANLVCWAGLAAAFGLVASDRVDLGIETLVRRGQATAVAVWDREYTRALQSIFEQQPDPTLPVTIAQAPPATQTTLTGSTLSPAAAQATPSTLAAGQPPASTPAASTTDLGGTLDNAAVSTAGPEATLVSTPLLLADPEINALRLLDAEWRHSAPARPVQIRYGEEALNRELSALSENAPDLPLRNVQVNLKRDRIIVTANVTILGFQVHTEIIGRLLAQDCRPYLEIETVAAAGVMPPKFVRDKVEQMMLEAMAWYPADYPLCLKQIVLEETQVTVYGYRR
jgi:hypothetical protein